MWLFSAYLAVCVVFCYILVRIAVEAERGADTKP